jgi:isopentenyl-diphosphate delta-isomerase
MLESDELVVLVDADDREIGQARKFDAHRSGRRHRAVSVCVIDGAGRMLVQRRAEAKYHSGGLWTNACCTHPRPGESAAEAASRRLFEELGVSCGLEFVLRTHYRAQVGGGLTEDEVVHVFRGGHDGVVRPNADEVADYAWRSREALRVDIAERPAAYTYWFKHYLRSFGDALFERPQDVYAGEAFHRSAANVACHGL